MNLATWLASLELNKEEWIFSSLAIFFFFSGLAVVAFLFASRVIKSRRQANEAFYREQFQKALNAIIILETTTDMPDSSYRFNIAELKRFIEKSALAKQAMINQLVAFRKSLLGASSSLLERIFTDLDLHRFCLRKLRSGSWNKKAQGIRELTEMNYADALDTIRRFLRARNTTLREETFMALVRLEQEKPLSFLNHYTGELTPWMRINIHHHLATLDVRKLPDFSQWFTSSNIDVILFSVSMTRQFRQSSSVRALADLLTHSNSKVVSFVIEALGELEAHEFAGKVAKTASAFWEDEKICARVARCLGKTGHTDQHVSVLEKQLSHPAYAVRFEAVLALTKIGGAAVSRLHDFNTRHEGRLAGILNHVAEPLLQ